MILIYFKYPFRNIFNIIDNIFYIVYCIQINSSHLSPLQLREN